MREARGARGLHPTAPRGPFLVAEVSGKLVAAASLDVPAMLLADPAHETTNIRALLFKW